MIQEVIVLRTVLLVTVDEALNEPEMKEILKKISMDRKRKATEAI